MSADSGSFTSLLALIDNHLSKTTVAGSGSENDSSLKIPSLHDGESGTKSETILAMSPGQRLPIPSPFDLRDSPITKVLAEQVSNMLKAKEKKKKEEEESQRLEEEMIKLKIQEGSSDCVIDLMEAMRTPYNPPTLVPRRDVLSSSSSLESLLEPKFFDCDLDPKRVKAATPEIPLPCTTDMSYLLTRRVCCAKGSSFGKVISSRLHHKPQPYLGKRYCSEIKRFDFATKSPCDMIIEKLRKPSHYNAFSFDIVPG